MNIFNILYLIVAIFGLGVLIFIHEFGHYIMAKKTKMRIETFSIGFGKPIISWEKNGVKWQICILPFGGYVKIAGMEKEGILDPHEIPDGFFGKKPLDRIKVALAGPLTNIIFAFFVFSYIWFVGGRDKNFAEFTRKIGYLDSKSKLYQNNVSVGDEILKINSKKSNGFKDLLMAPFFDGNKEIEIAGNKINYLNNQKTSFDYKLPLQTTNFLGNEIKTFGVQSPAMYLILSQDTQDSPVLKNFNLKANDRLLFANGEILFSKDQLDNLLNEDSVLLSVKRNNRVIAIKVYLSKLSDLKIPLEYKNEISDWKYCNKICKNLNDIKIIPYILSDDNTVENSLCYINESSIPKLNSRNIFEKPNPLQKKDKIVAISGHIIKNRKELLNYFQNPPFLLVIQRDKAISNETLWRNEDKDFDENLNISSLKKMIASLGFENKIKTLNNLILLDSIYPQTYKELIDENTFFTEDYNLKMKMIESEKNLDKKAEYTKSLNNELMKKKLAIRLTDKIVKYNPNPISTFVDVFSQTYKTIYALIKGYVSPKHLVGPVGIVKMAKDSWSFGYLEGLFWLGFISLNLGIFNLLPLPVLDGGHVLFSFIEIVIRRPIKIKTMEKFIIPFVILLILGTLFVTYHDILRIIKNLF